MTKTVVTSRHSAELLRPKEQLAGIMKSATDVGVLQVLTPLTTCGSMSLESVAEHVRTSLLPRT